MYLTANTIEAKIHNGEYGVSLQMLIDANEKRFIAIESELSALKIRMNAIVNRINETKEEE
jgi:hypothetical protein